LFYTEVLLVAGGQDYLRGSCLRQVQCLKILALLLKMSFPYGQVADQHIQKKDLGMTSTKQMIVLLAIPFVFSCSHSMVLQYLKDGFLFGKLVRKLSPGLGMRSPCGLSSANVVYGIFFHD